MNSGDGVEVRVPVDMSVRERSAYRTELEGLGGDLPSTPAQVLAGYIRRSASPGSLCDERQKAEDSVQVPTKLLEAIGEALMGLDGSLIRQIGDVLSNGHRRVVGEREACARDWEASQGFDKYGVAAWLRTGKL